MNRLVQELIRPFLEGENKYDIIVYGGGFKPPTAGHLYVAQSAFKIPALQYKIVIGGKIRGNITPEIAQQIWELYKNKGELPQEVDILQTQAPGKYVVNLAKENPDAKIAFVVGARNEEDLKDIAQLSKSLNRHGIAIEIIQSSNPDISGTKARRALQTKDKETFTQLFPKNFREEIWNIVTKSLIPEVQEEKDIAYKAGRFIPNSPSERLKDRGIGLITSKTGLLGTGYFFVKDLENAKNIKKKYNYGTLSQIDLTPYNLYKPDDPVNFYENVKALTSYMMGLKREELTDPTVESNLEDAIDAFSEYLGLDKEKTKNVFDGFLNDIFTGTDGDLLTNRLLSNYDGIDLRGTPYDDFGAGSLIFNGKLKDSTYSELSNLNEGSSKSFKFDDLNESEIQFIEEGRYDQEGLIISRFTLNQFKENLGKEFEDTFEIGLLEDVEYTLELAFYPNDTMAPPFFRVDAASDKNALNITINYDPSIFPKAYNALNSELKDSIRHELEHLGQFNFPKGTKYRKGTPDKGFEYYTLDFEIPAFVQGIYKKAKTQKIPFSQALEDFLDERMDELSPQEEDKLRQIYLDFARKNLPVAQIDEVQTPAKEEDVDPKELKMGIEVEMEHTDSKKKAKVIALQHLAEDPKYYTKLAKVGLEEQQEDKLKPLIIDFTSFLVTDGMKIHPFPKIKFIDNDTKNAEDPLGKTAYYNPQEKSITLFTLKRHPKDILRSYSHELVHHMQNLEGRLKPMTTTNVYEDEELAEIEKEAHELGSLNLRKWEDSQRGSLMESPQKYKIYSDMDGVITDFDERFKKISNGVPPREYEEKNGKEAFWELISSGGVGWWVGMPWMPDGKKYWNYIKDYDVELLSAPSRDNSSKLGKRLWVKNNLPGVKLNLFYAVDKQKLAAPNHILIDDRPSNIDQWRSKGGIGILHTSADNTIKQLKQLGL